MMKHSSRFQRILALVLAIAMVLSLGVGQVAATGARETGLSYTELDHISADLTGNANAMIEENQEEPYAEDEMVRVTIVMEAPSMLEQSGLDLQAALSAENQSLRTALETQQAMVQRAISRDVLGGEELDVAWNLTLVANSISANVAFGKIDEIAMVDGVKDVFLETQYMPLTADKSNVVAQGSTGALAVKNNSGYTGAGRRVAVIDTGTDTDHQSFDEGGYLFALEKLAKDKGMDVDAYTDSLNLLGVEEIASVLGQLNAFERNPSLTAEDLYGNTKLAFNYNYIDGNLDVTHDNDEQGEHGSHVAGIAAANSYIPTDGKKFYDFDNDGDFDRDDAQVLLDYSVQNIAMYNVSAADVNGDGAVTPYDAHILLDNLEALEADGVFYADAAAAVGVTGTAADAQLLTMKVFGAAGGAYASDYMAAVEDALVLGCDVVNLSLGEPNAGFSKAHASTDEESAYIDGILEMLAETDMVMAIAAGNSSNWATYDMAYGYMYTDEGGTAITSSPATYTNALSVASSDNVGSMVDNTTVFTGENGMVQTVVQEVSGGFNRRWTSLDDTRGTTYEVVFLGDPTNLLSGKEQTDMTVYGDLASFEGLDFTGKIVLVARGNAVTFADKHTGAAGAGAAAVMIYNNTSGTLNASIEGSTATVPCVGLHMDEAARILDLCQVVDGVYTCSVTITSGLTTVTMSDTPTMSDFSSWGSTGGLKIKPEITAPGGNIYSVYGSTPYGGGSDRYELMSGTSMATPHLTGLVALANQYMVEMDLIEDARAVSGIETLSRRVLTQSLLMSTATPLVTANGNAYSVRNQGSGLANIEALVKAESFILVDGQPDGKVKAELGDGTTGWTYGFTVYNISDETICYHLDTSVLTTDTYEADGYYLSAEEMVELGARVTYGGDAANGCVTVENGGMAYVTVTIEVTEEAIAGMRELGYVNGFYVEGFTTLDGGENVVRHSIPLLGWYGNWTDISMFEDGSYVEYLFGEEVRPSHIGSTMTNMLAWTQDGATGYAYGGNVYAMDATSESHYDPARNAVNGLGTGSWQIYALFPTLIRNAADIEVRVLEAETGRVLHVDDYEHFDDIMLGSFYYVNAGQWYDTTTDYGVASTWDFTDPETGKPIAEGTRVVYQLEVAPEYYVNEDGSVRWDELGHGTTMNFEMTIDNTKPQLTDEGMSLSADGKTLTVNARDNNYIAAMILLDGTGNYAYSYYYPDMATEEKGMAVTAHLDLEEFSQVYGNKAVVVVTDYAGNEAYYAINLGGEGSSYGDLVAYQYDIYNGINTWVSFGEGVKQNETGLFTAGLEIVAAEYVNGLVFAQTATGDLYGFHYSDMLSGSLDLETTYIAHLNNVYQDFAYSYFDGKLYGLYSYEDNGYPISEVNTINLRGAYYDENLWADVAPYQEDWAGQRGGLYGLGLAIDDDGSIYIMGLNYDWDTETTTETAHLWKAVMEEDRWAGLILGAFQDMGDTGLTMDYLQAMTWDHNTETLYWARFAPVGAFDFEVTLEKVNPETAECQRAGTLTSETCALFAPLSAETAAKEEHRNVPDMNPDEIGTPIVRMSVATMNVGSTLQLGYDLDPWYTNHKEVLWSSSDETIATVDNNGLVTSLAEGEVVITAAAKDDVSKFTTCTIQVSALDLEIEGVVSVQGSGIGNVSGTALYKYTMKKGVPTMTAGNRITAPAELNFGLNLATTAMGRGSLWASEFGNTGMVYELDPETGVVKNAIEPINGHMLFGLSYSEATDAFTGIMNMLIMVDQPLNSWATGEMMKYYEEHREFGWRTVNMLPYLLESNKGFVTGETGQGASSEIVFCGVTTLPGGYVHQDNGMDYLGNYSYEMASYTATHTLVLLDNVGRMWYIDEITGLSYMEDEWGNQAYTDAEGTCFLSPNRHGVIPVEITDENGNTTYSVLYIRKLQETPLTDMFRLGQMPRITYHYSDIEYAGETVDGGPMFFLSLCDYWNNGTTNALYLYVPGVATGEREMDENWNWVDVVTADRMFDLGDTGEHNIVATIHNAKVTGGVVSQLENTETTKPMAVGIYVPADR